MIDKIYILEEGEPQPPPIVRPNPYQSPRVPRYKPKPAYKSTFWRNLIITVGATLIGGMASVVVLFICYLLNPERMGNSYEGFVKLFHLIQGLFHA